MLKLCGPTSTNTGSAPKASATSAVAAKPKAGMKTAAPAPMPSAMRAINSASVPLETPIAWAAPVKRASAASSSVTSGPRMNWR